MDVTAPQAVRTAAPCDGLAIRPNMAHVMPIAMTATVARCSVTARRTARIMRRTESEAVMGWGTKEMPVITLRGLSVRPVAGSVNAFICVNLVSEADKGTAAVPLLTKLTQSLASA